MSRVSPLLDISRQIHAKRLVVLTNAVPVAHSRHLQLLLFWSGDNVDAVIRSAVVGPAPACHQGLAKVQRVVPRLSQQLGQVSETFKD